MNRTEAQTALDRLREEKARAVDELTAAREALDVAETSSGDRLLTARLNSDEAAAAKGIREELAAARLAVAAGSLPALYRALSTVPPGLLFVRG